MFAHWISEGVVLLPAEITVPKNASWRLVTEAGIFNLLPLPNQLPASSSKNAQWAPYRVAMSDGTTPSVKLIERALQGPLSAELVHQKGKVIAAVGVQFPWLLDELYADVARTRKFGATVKAGTVDFALWAPTARSVHLLVWPDSRGFETAVPDSATDGEGPTRRLRNGAFQNHGADGLRVPMVRQADGTWTFDTAALPDRPNWVGASYLYEVCVCAPSTGRVETNLVTDPASVGLTLGSQRSVVVDLDDPQWAPEIWTETPAPRLEQPVDHTIYELHVRDFSRDDTTVPLELRGKYLAFTCTDSAGVQHLRELRAAGMNTIHLLPTFDIASIPEDPAAQKTVTDLSGFASNSSKQQAAIAKIRDKDAWNWGYDPLHWDVPEGSYAVAADGGTRTFEYRAMVGALHSLGYEVVADQVFNHTMANGQDKHSLLDRIVPGYYYRLCLRTGEVFDSTCCPNIATEHKMAEKLMLDSLVLWAKHYKIDGFRFDLMGHHTRANLLNARRALDDLTLEKDGVAGKSIYLYGEGWNFGEVKNDALFVQARQGNLGGTGIGTFSDRLRDAVIGGTPTEDEAVFAQGFGTGLYWQPNGLEADLGDTKTVQAGSETELARLLKLTDNICLGIAGNLRSFEIATADGNVKRGDQIPYDDDFVGYADEPAETVNYVDAHDNETLYDYLVLKLPRDLSMADRVRMNTLCLALVTLSQGVSFWHAGTDKLRSKSLDRNSFDSGDWFNFIDWTGTESGFGRGLPPADDNKERWPFEKSLLADPALKPTTADMTAAAAAALDLLRLRFSTRLFRLGDAEQIKQKVSFPLAGAAEYAGVIAMLIDDTIGTDIDPLLAGVLVIFNARPGNVTLPLNALRGRNFELSEIQTNGCDPIVKQSRFDCDTGNVTVPARTVAVFTAK